MDDIISTAQWQEVKAKAGTTAVVWWFLACGWCVYTLDTVRFFSLRTLPTVFIGMFPIAFFFGLVIYLVKRVVFAIGWNNDILMVLGMIFIYLIQFGILYPIYKIALYFLIY